MKKEDTEDPDPAEPDVPGLPRTESGVPGHVAIIMDGNGRWAKERGKSRSAGHQAGADALKRVVRSCAEIGVGYVTVYAFSVDNWKRPRREVSFLMDLLKRYLQSESASLTKEGISLGVIGNLERFPKDVQREIKKAVEKSAGGKRLHFTVALSYGGQEEIISAAARLAEKAKAGEITPNALDKAAFERELFTAGLPPVDLLIRTGGEQRLSNFLLYQVSYAELYFTETFWPDFDKEELMAALQEFARRERRFGGLREERWSAQV